jgi:threonine synthase
MHGYSYTDHQIKEVIGKVFRNTGYLCDPHGAIGYQAARTHLDTHPGSTGIFLETAHPAKFKESVEEVIGEPVEIPKRLAAFAEKEKRSVVIPPSFSEFKNYLSDY